MKPISIIVGGLVAMAAGIPWYMGLQTQWMSASGVTMEQANAGGATPYICGLIAWLVAAYAINYIVDRTSDRSLGGMLGLGVHIWLGGAITGVVLNTMYGMRGINLIWIDGLYLLIGILLILIVRKFINR